MEKLFSQVKLIKVIQRTNLKVEALEALLLMKENRLELSNTIINKIKSLHFSIKKWLQKNKKGIVLKERLLK